ncbi:cyclase family protein [Isachenkonia alkalipeptolytica]|uniref:Cyclase family protein n=1 Tax=Isachenkonia alkalipeptolytica TaxID=2565777 RepID=A0AA43XJI9_9CLOT|nr:cyclase family protein [Isachenkonia alkalipeptolytica]NBG87993.1 cyclase family protein [Isachenkonia alkalipeptolytica]
MKIVDLTQKLTEDMPLFPGTPGPKFTVKHTVETDGFREMEISLYSHTGTHLDTPAHVFPRGKNLEDYGADQFCGSGLVLDFSRLGEKEITPDLFEEAMDKALSQPRFQRKTMPKEGEEEKDRRLSSIEYLFFYTGWDKKWGDKSYLTGSPILSQAVAKKVTTLDLKGIGIDAISVDPLEGDGLLAHRILLEKEIIIVENLKNLGGLLQENFEFYGLPLKIPGGEGSPIRGVAKIR